MTWEGLKFSMKLRQSSGRLTKRHMAIVHQTVTANPLCVVTRRVSSEMSSKDYSNRIIAIGKPIQEVICVSEASSIGTLWGEDESHALSGYTAELTKKCTRHVVLIRLASVSALNLSREKSLSAQSVCELTRSNQETTNGDNSPSLE